MRVRVFYCMYRGGGTGLRNLDRHQAPARSTFQNFQLHQDNQGVVCACVCRVRVAFLVHYCIMAIALVNCLGLGSGSALPYKESQSGCGVGNRPPVDKTSRSIQQNRACERWSCKHRALSQRIRKSAPGFARECFIRGGSGCSITNGWRTGKRVPVESYAMGRGWSMSLNHYASIAIWSGRD